MFRRQHELGTNPHVVTQILREVGGLAYTKAVRLISGPDYEWFRYLEETILEHFIGPDCYWKPHGSTPRRCTKFFGNAWWIPFPPTLVSPGHCSESLSC